VLRSVGSGSAKKKSLVINTSWGFSDKHIVKNNKISKLYICGSFRVGPHVGGTGSVLRWDICLHTAVKPRDKFCKSASSISEYPMGFTTTV